MATAAACIGPAAAGMPGAISTTTIPAYNNIISTYIVLSLLTAILLAAIRYLYDDSDCNICMRSSVPAKLHNQKTHVPPNSSRPKPRKSQDEEGSTHIEDEQPILHAGGDAVARVTRGHPPKAHEQLNSQRGKGVVYQDRAWTECDAVARVTRGHPPKALERLNPQSSTNHGRPKDALDFGPLGKSRAPNGRGSKLHSPSSPNRKKNGQPTPTNGDDITAYVHRDSPKEHTTNLNGKNSNNLHMHADIRARGTPGLRQVMRHYLCVAIYGIILLYYDIIKYATGDYRHYDGISVKARNIRKYFRYRGKTSIDVRYSKRHVAATQRTNIAFARIHTYDCMWDWVYSRVTGGSLTLIPGNNFVAGNGSFDSRKGCQNPHPYYVCDSSGGKRKCNRPTDFLRAETKPADVDKWCHGSDMLAVTPCGCTNHNHCMPDGYNYVSASNNDATNCVCKSASDHNTHDLVPSCDLPYRVCACKLNKQRSSAIGASGNIQQTGTPGRKCTNIFSTNCSKVNPSGHLHSTTPPRSHAAVLTDSNASANYVRLQGQRISDAVKAIMPFVLIVGFLAAPVLTNMNERQTCLNSLPTLANGSMQCGDRIEFVLRTPPNEDFRSPHAECLRLSPAEPHIWHGTHLKNPDPHLHFITCQAPLAQENADVDRTSGDGFDETIEGMFNWLRHHSAPVAGTLHRTAYENQCLLGRRNDPVAAPTFREKEKESYDCDPQLDRVPGLPPLSPIYLEPILSCRRSENFSRTKSVVSSFLPTWSG